MSQTGEFDIYSWREADVAIFRITFSYTLRLNVYLRDHQTMMAVLKKGRSDHHKADSGSFKHDGRSAGSPALYFEGGRSRLVGQRSFGLIDMAPMARDSAGYDGKIIKPEPMDEDIEMTDSIFVPEALYESAEAAQSARPKDYDGDPFATICFSKGYRDHPYKHKLNCGHYISTDEVEVCGSNCKLARIADSKPSTAPFLCPHPNCSKVRNLFMQKKTKKRLCELSHIYGINAQDDEARKNEKASYAQRGRKSIRSDQISLWRKNSVSPDRRQRTTRKSTRQATAISTAADIDAEMDQAERELFQAQGGRHTRRIRGDRLETEEETQTDLNQAQAQRSLDRMTIGKALSRKKGKSQNFSTANPVNTSIDLRDQDNAGLNCDGCDKVIKHVWFHCLDCADNHRQLGFDLCEECHGKRETLNYVSRSHRNDHKFGKTTRSRAPDVIDDERFPRMTENNSVDFEMEDTWCVCKSKVNDNMLDCEKCQNAFHLGCVGEGWHTDAQYGLDNAEEYHRVDFEKVKKEGIKEFICLDCKRGDEASAQALKNLQDDLRRAREMVANSTTDGQRAQKKRSPADADLETRDTMTSVEQNENDRNRELFGEEDEGGERDEVRTPARPVKCAKTGEDVPTFGRMNLPFHGKKS
ncbi:hypothetical protein AC579_3995 [Pseudocercospora musae]|uniref:Zinc finger PHD-type domain-containing protein n=1 Tax=Pseudocercospora musae TaxID=113226 RepID=A0A139IHY8_9PEZI|nr:hypothetical protein AC579_3995 [Pseudocercospora musae]